MSQRYVDLSSDDDGRRDAEAKRKAYKRRSLGGPIYNREQFMKEVVTYTDEELFQQLKRYNFDCGPISGSTRKVYQKKLADKMVEGPPPPPPKIQRRSMGPTIRSMPAKMPEPEPGEDLISGSSGSDVEPEFEPDFIQRPIPPIIQENSNPIYLNSKGQKKIPPAHKPDVTTESLLPSIQLKRIDKEQKSVSPPREEHAKHPSKIQPMHKEKVKPRTKSSPGRDTGSKEEVSVWVQIIILIICVLVTLLFLNYIQSTETLPSSPDLPIASLVTGSPVLVDAHNGTQHSTHPEETALPSDPVTGSEPQPQIPSGTSEVDSHTSNTSSSSPESSEGTQKKKEGKKKKISTSKKTKESQKGTAR